MKNIINWTLGGFFRALGRVLCFLVIGLIIGIIVAKSDLRFPSWLGPLYVVHADSVSYNYSQYRTQYYQLSSGTSAWNNWTNFGTSTALSNGYGVSTVAFRFGLTNKFQANTNYRVVIEVGYSPSSTINDTFVNVDSVTCAGSSTSTWSSDTSLIESCTYLGAIKVSGTNHVKYVIDVVPTLAIYGFQFNLAFVGTSEVSSLRAHTSSEILTGNDVGSVIEEQTLIIQDGFQDITNIINQTNEDLINAITENDKVCKTLLINGDYSTSETKKYLNQSGTPTNSNSYNISRYIPVNSSTKIIVKRSTSRYACFYTDSYVLISCAYIDSTSVNNQLTIPTNAKYFRGTLCNSASCLGSTHFIIESCDKSGQATYDALTDTDTDSDSNSLADWFNNFTVSIEGPLSSIVLLPINLLETLVVDYNESAIHPGLCATLNGQEFCVPSGDLVWKRSGCHDNSWFGCPDYASFKSFFQLVAGGFIIFHLLRRIVKTIDKALDPTDSEVKVVDL